MAANPFQRQELIRHIIATSALSFLPDQWVVFLALLFYMLGIGYRYREQLESAAEKKELQKSHAAQNWDKILGVSANASVEECIRVRKLLTEIYHPTYGKAPHAPTMNLINLALAYRKQINAPKSRQQADESEEQPAS